MYLALEDGHRRLQDRFRRILSGGAIPADISLITVATPSQALCAIAEFIARHAADQPLIILDTLGKIRSAKRPGEDAYQADYAVGAKLKSLVAAAPGSTLLIVHHTRKAESVDFVDSVSGTQGIAGSVDFILALNRKRHANDALLNVTGRDVTEARIALTADEGVLWRLDIIWPPLRTPRNTAWRRRSERPVNGRVPVRRQIQRCGRGDGRRQGARRPRR